MAVCSCPFAVSPSAGTAPLRLEASPGMTRFPGGTEVLKPFRGSPSRPRWRVEPSVCRKDTRGRRAAGHYQGTTSTVPKRETSFADERRRGGARVDTELREDVLQVPPDSPGRYPEGLRDLGIGPALGDEVQDLSLARCELRKALPLLEKQRAPDEIDDERPVSCIDA